jgi:hypothetical protein
MTVTWSPSYFVLAIIATTPFILQRLFMTTAHRTTADSSSMHDGNIPS